MWLSDLRLVLPERVLEPGSLRIEDGVIAEVIEGSVPNAPSLRGLTAIPGIVDLHGDMLERDVEPRPGARFPHDLGLLELDKRLAASGITTAFAAISFAWKENDIRSQENATSLINVINERKHDLLVDMKVHARFEVTNLLTAPVLSELLHGKKVDLVSIMDHTPGQGQYGDINRYINFVQTWIGVDLDVFEPGLQARLVEQIKKRMNEQVQKRRDWEIVRDVARIAREYHIPLASHDDDTVEKVADQAELGVTISEFPINLESAEEAHRHGMMIIMGAPNAYRKQSTGNNLSALDAIKAGLVDILATDYYPPAMLHAAFQLADEGVLPLHESVKLISTNPAKAVNLNDRGTLTVGARADLVLIEPGKHQRVRATLRAGVPIYSDAYMAQALAWKESYAAL
ncbi:MAG TPA: alpha-D-ribose 1-methylphosphonate 5-triphosphate diphosphatase [Phototrophicaceae bacterium]|nr:alpha-D-ribose 1-methylphosphonate 5-triphosphate diphosphatase [Phototrophicaceae bacterium]